MLQGRSTEEDPDRVGEFIFRVIALLAASPHNPIKAQSYRPTLPTIFHWQISEYEQPHTIGIEELNAFARSTDWPAEV
jgi:hypothetical protein